MSELQKKADWVQNIIRNPRVSFTINDTIFKGTARIVEQDKEPQSTAEVSKLMCTRYGWNGGLIVELVYHQILPQNIVALQRTLTNPQSDGM